MEPDHAGLIQRVEDEFEISISEDETQRVRTAGDLHRLVLRKLVVDGSSRAFFVIQCALASELGIERRTLGAHALLEPLLPLAIRPEQWNRISRFAGVRLPRLRHSQRLNDRILLASMAISSLPVLAIWWAMYALDWIRGKGIWLFCLPAALAFLLIESRVDKDLMRWTWRKATEIPFKTVGELAEAVLAINRSLLETALGNARWPSSAMVWEKLTELIRQTAGEDNGQIMPGTAIPELLKVN